MNNPTKQTVIFIHDEMSDPIWSGKINYYCSVIETLVGRDGEKRHFIKGIAWAQAQKLPRHEVHASGSKKNKKKKPTAKMWRR